jgi:hypothetical protein
MYKNGIGDSKNVSMVQWEELGFTQKGREHSLVPGPMFRQEAVKCDEYVLDSPFIKVSNSPKKILPICLQWANYVCMRVRLYDTI